MPDPSRADYTLWRAYVPRWSYLPLSGEGAARFGGRWNPAGAATVYAALELSTAWAEYNQGFVQHPALLAQLRLQQAALADLRLDDMLRLAGCDRSIHDCEWRALLDAGKRPPTYAVRDRLLKRGFDGVIFPSFMSPGGNCVAIWRWNEPGAPDLHVVDPDGRLPASPASWR